MLRIEEARTKTYEERMSGVISEIPLFSDEWTNYNPSDPGITVLENLTAFAALQAAEIPNVPYDAKRRLFQLAGFSPAKGKCSRVLLKAEGVRDDVLKLPSGFRFHIGDLVFETNRPLEVGGNLLGIYGMVGGEVLDLSLLTVRDVPVGMTPFGEEPKEGDALYFVSDRLPEAGKELILYIEIQQEIKRNPVLNRSENVFASLKWECFTGAGFEEIKVRDFTGCFLMDGEIRLRVPEGAKVYGGLPKSGYCIRATLTRCAYDIPPRFTEVDSFLFEVWQRDTRANSVIFNKTDSFVVKHPLCSDELALVFAKEEKGSSYRRYRLSYSGTEAGRYCKYTPGKRNADGRITDFKIEFGVPGSAYKPLSRVKDPVRVVLYSQEVMQSYSVGRVEGYDDQELELPIKRIVQDSFCLIARREDNNGDYYYDFVRPEKDEEGALYYHLLENDGKILIEDAGAFIGADLFIGSVAVTKGEKGNVRAKSRFFIETPIPDINFYNPGAGTGGAFRETLKELGVRFRRDVDTPYTLVTARDYERIALETPGLCLRKAHAVINESENLVQVAILPATEEDPPILSDIYRNEIAKRLDERRLLTTRIVIVPPQVVEIHVRGTIYVKRHYEKPKEIIEEALRTLLDDIHSDRNFGETLYFRDVFSELENLECVAFVYELSLVPDDRSLARLKDSDIYPRADTLCKAGEIAIEIVAEQSDIF